MYCIVWQGVRRTFAAVQNMFDEITLASFLRWRAALHVISSAVAAAAFRFRAARGAKPLYQIRWSNGIGGRKWSLGGAHAARSTLDISTSPVRALMVFLDHATCRVSHAKVDVSLFFGGRSTGKFT